MFKMPSNLRVKVDGEEEAIRQFWDREVEKCYDVKKRREEMKTNWENEQRLEAINAAQKEKEDLDPEAEKEVENQKEDAYQELRLLKEAQLGHITDEELDVK